MKIRILTYEGFSHHIVLPLLAVFAVGGIGYYMLNMSNAATAGLVSRKAYRAADFIDSQGVVAHVDADETYKNKTQVGKALDYLGIHNVRARGVGGGEVRTYLAENNVKFNFMISVRPGGTLPFSEHHDSLDNKVESRVQDILTQPRSGNKFVKSTAYVESLNEYDNKANGDPHWDDALAYTQNKLWAAKSRLTAQNPNVKILGPAFIGYQVKTSAQKMQAKNIGSMMDYGNVHSYPSGKAPETSLKPDDGLDGFVVPESELPSKVTDDIGQKLQHYSTRVSGTKRIVVTEEGYHDYAAPAEGTNFYTDPRAVGIYMPRVFLENFRIGVLKTYIYELFDERAHSKEYEKHYGLFGSGLDADPKPAATAVHNMNQVLNDSAEGATTFRTSRLKYSIPEQPADVKTVLLQKNSGKFYLVVWKAETVFTPNKNASLSSYTGPTAARPYTIKFDRSRRVNAFYDGSTTTTSLGSSKKNFTFNVSARPTILEIQ